jgi:N-acyl-D-amino-acid deacylase
VTYYDEPTAPTMEPMPGLGLKGRVVAPYGAFAIEAFDSLGQTIGAPLDFLRFMLAIDGRRGKALLSPEALRAMRERPVFPENDGKQTYYALGFQVRQIGSGFTWFHGGSQPGMEALAVRFANGNAWVVAFNTRPRDRSGFHGDYDRALNQAASRVGGNWPTGDLWSEFR